METDLHVKPTSKHQYLHIKSCHPNHCKTAIPYSQALRVKRICLEWENLLLRLNQLKHYLARGGYSEQLLDCEINRAIDTSGNSSPSISNQRNSNRVPLVVTYHRNLPKLEQTIRHYHYILQDSERLREAIPSLPINAFRRPRNLRDLLVRAIISPEKSDVPGNFRCEARRCKTCPILVTTDMFTSSVTGERFNLKLRASCKTSNIIYLIQCRRCGLQYVGETGQPLHYRMNGHRFDISHGRIDESPVAAHFNSEGHSETDLSVMVIDVCWKKDTILRKIRESRWIRTLDTSWPSGMNLRIDGL